MNKMPYVTSWERLGIKEGKKEGIKLGIKEGKKEGIKVGKRATARELLRYGVDMDIIIKSTRLPKKEIEALKAAVF